MSQSNEPSVRKPNGLIIFGALLTLLPSLVSLAIALHFPPILLWPIGALCALVFPKSTLQGVFFSMSASVIFVLTAIVLVLSPLVFIETPPSWPHDYSFLWVIMIILWAGPIVWFWGLLRANRQTACQGTRSSLPVRMPLMAILFVAITLVTQIQHSVAASPGEAVKQTMAALHTGFGRLPAADGLHAVTLDPRGRLRYGAPHPPSADHQPLIFIHGFLGNPDLWQAMIAKLMAAPGAASRYECYTYGYDYERSTQETGAMLAKQSASLALRHIVFICHSMGGLVAKEAASILIKTSGTVAKIITLGTPHNGLFLAAVLTGATLAVKSQVIEATIASALAAFPEDFKHEVAKDLEQFRAYLGMVVDFFSGGTPGSLSLILPPPHMELKGVPCYVVVGNLFPLMGDGGGDGLVEVQSARGRGGWPAIARADKKHFTEIRAFHVELAAPMNWLPGSRGRFEASCRAVTGYLNDHGGRSSKAASASGRTR